MRPLLLSLAFLALVALSPLKAFASDASALAKYGPASATVAVGIDIERLRETSVYKEILALAKARPEYASSTGALEKAGFNPETDLRSILVLVGDMEKADQDFLVLLEGKFDRAKAEAAIATEDVVKATEGSATLFLTTKSEQKAATAFLSDSVLAVGTEKQVRAALAKKPAGVGKALGQQIKRADSKKVLWFAATVPAAQQKQQDVTVKAISGHIDIGKTLGARILAALGSEEEAKKQVEEFTAMLPMLASSPELKALGLDAVVSGITAKNNGADFQLDLAVPEETWNKLVQTLLAIVKEELR